MSQPNDAAAAAAIRAHHAELHDRFADLVRRLGDAVRGGSDPLAARDALLAFLDTELLPHARAEEAVLYPAGERGETAELVRAMIDEHRVIVARIGALRTTTDGLELVAGSSALLALFESHLAKENERLIPALAADPAVALAERLAGMRELLGAA
jgi:iron-sulfur cluster repair protein YtfE (RIC family)